MCLKQVKLLKIKLILLTLTISTILWCNFYKKDDPYDNVEDIRVLLWWTEFYGSLEPYVRDCGDTKCLITENRKYLNDHRLKAILFYGSNIKHTDFPIPRKQSHIWGLLHDESPKNTPFLMYETGLNLFNYTSTFSRYSDVPFTNHYFKSIHQLISDQYLVPIELKNEYQRNENVSPVLYVQSICNTMSDRDSYVKELMKYIDVDSYGECLNNRRMPKELSENYISKIDSDEFFNFIARYKFVIAYENAVCNDYITEKFWRPLIVGTIPIYFGSPTIRVIKIISKFSKYARFYKKYILVLFSGLVSK